MLDLDDIRANRLPDNYDTDLEYPWSDQSKIISKFRFQRKNLMNKIRIIC